MVRLRRTRDREKTPGPMMEPPIDVGAVEARNLSLDHIRRCCPRSLHALHFFDLLRGQSLCKLIALKNICSTLAVVVSLAEGTAGCILFLSQAMQLKQKSASVVEESQSMELIVLHRVPHVLAYGMEQKKLILISG